MNFTYEWLDSSKLAIKRICNLTGSTLGIPNDPSNTDYLEFLFWCEEGNEPLPYIDPTTIDNAATLTEAKKIASEEVRNNAYLLLQPTDWVVVRESEIGTPAPEDIKTYRTAIRSTTQNKITTIESKSELSMLKTYLRSNEYKSW